MNKLIFALSLVAAAASGCSVVPKQGARYAGSLGSELRGAAPVHARQARALVSGPVLVKHLETDGDGVVTLYLADDPGIGDRACPSAPAENAAPIAVLARDSRVADLAVPAGKRICAAVSATHTMTVTWHARATGDAPAASFDLALRSALEEAR